MTDKLKMGGLALQNGVLLMGPTSWACAVYDKDKKLIVRGGQKPGALNASKTGKIPVVRGVTGMGQMLGVMPFVKKQMPEAKFSQTSPVTYLPMIASMFITSALSKKYGKDSGQVQLAGTLVPLIGTALTVKGTALGRFHGAEHKAVSSYELDVDAKDAPKEHPRCGTGLAVVATALGGVSQYLLAKKLSRLQASLLGQVIGIGVGTEILKASLRENPDALGRFVQKVSMTAQSVATVAEPTKHELDAGVAALAELISQEEAVAKK